MKTGVTKYCGVLFCLAAALFLVRTAEAGAPRRIVSCGPAVTEKLYLLGAEESIAGVTTYCVRPPEARKKPKVGSVTLVNVEKVVSLKPDLVCATSLTDPRSIKKFRDLGIEVAVFGEPRSFAGMNEQFIEMGRLTGREQAARDIVREAVKKVKAVRAETGKIKTRPRVFLQIGSNPLFAASKESLLHDFVEFSNGIHVAPGSKGGFVSREEVVTENPDVILIVAMEGAVAEKEKRVWQRFATMKAVKDRAIYVLDPYAMCSPTPVTFVAALKTVAEIIHRAPGKGASQ